MRGQQNIELISVFLIVIMRFAFIVQYNLPDDVTHSELGGMSTEKLYLYCKNDVAGMAAGIPCHTVQRLSI